ncbi:pyridoxamine 5'-phosphate oxidase family protein [Nodosilinea sp. LEGE 07088]|uniref:HugZ family pyridoxamine 5'-phosphate oxidase n=1 Tax=Nodosilinea sp. LEGE 07088 TaxID=2777968 RepID=UPI001880415C|nr:pyridoxamine 5'-phosphate oxidase family protein [Nodosilinea sp. LEGE 07088]MBE9136244.1 pyridoxamine 5'-phosphate oxidase family protein [Nodosilinea sp. LEGE 07088]
MPSFDAALAAYQDLPQRVRSLMLSTVSGDSSPHASYAPYILDDDYQIYIFTSGLSAHTNNLQATGVASVLLIEDETAAPQVFARQRITYDCNVTLLPRGSDPWGGIADRFEQRFGDIIAMLRSLDDFQIFCLSPQKGRFVMGFGAAYAIDPNSLSQLLGPPQTGLANEPQG